MEMLNLLPKILDAVKLAKKNATIEGCVLLSSLDKISEYKNTDEALVTVSFTFHLGKKKSIFIDGIINTELQLVCQRCMKQVLYPISSEFTLICIDNQNQEKQLSEKHEFVLLNNDKLEVYTLLQEEIILAMPIIAYHNSENCTKTQSYFCKDNSDKNDQHNQKIKNSKNPFAILKHLKCD